MSVEKEIFIGLVGGVGVDFEAVICALKNELKRQNFIVEDLVLSDFVRQFYRLSKAAESSELERISYLMDKATTLRKKYCNSILTLLSIAKIYELRNKYKNSNVRVAYILKSFKRPEEIKLMRRMYGRNFILVSVHSSDDFRNKNLLQIEISKNKNKSKDSIKKRVKELIEKDFQETYFFHKKNGQNLAGTFPYAHVFVNTDKELKESITRFFDILFDHPFHTPTIDERNMFIAKGVALRSSDLSRQVGAVIANKNGDVIATGCNDVPKFGGGFYEPDDPSDKRDFQKGKDSNVQEKIEILEDIIKKLAEIYPDICKKNIKTDDLYSKLDQVSAKITDLLEFGRPVHAEMEAICDAARRGISVVGSTLYCTTYPCHLCAKLILAVGIRRVVYIDPYPKSAAKKLFDEAIKESQGDIHEHDNFLIVDAFMGIAPRRYLYVFKQDNRKLKDKLNAKLPERSNDSNFLYARSPINYILREITVLKILKEKFNLQLPARSALGKVLNECKSQFSKLSKINSIKDWAIKNWDEIVQKKKSK